VKEKRQGQIQSEKHRDYPTVVILVTKIDFRFALYLFAQKGRIDDKVDECILRLDRSSVVSVPWSAFRAFIDGKCQETLAESG
jgi:hypothetical protein